MGFPASSDGKVSTLSVKTRVRSLHQEDPMEKGMQPTPVSLLGELHGQRALTGYSPWDRKESDTANTLLVEYSY